MIDDVRLFLADEGGAAEELADMDTPMVRNRNRAKDPSQVYSLRIPVDQLEDLRQVAARQHAAPSALMRRWVLERLDVELARGSNLEQRRQEVLTDRSDEQLFAVTESELGELISKMIHQQISQAEGRGKHGRND